MKTYLDFEVQIGAPDADRYPVSISGPGGDASGFLSLPTANPEFLLLQERLRTLDTDEPGLAELGQILFDALFQGPLRDVYTRSQGMLEIDQGLRVRLNITPAATAAIAMPWEFLYDPNLGPLTLLDMPVVRYLPQQDRLPTLAAPLPLKVLLTAAQTPPATDVERELTAAAEALASMGDRVEVTIEPHLTTSAFQKMVRSGFHVWHFVGHGGFARDGVTGQLQFEDASGDPESVSALQLGIMLNRSGLRLVVLDACSSGQLATDSFRSMAPALIRAQVPAVIAMQFQVPEEATRAFATEFYRALSEGLALDGCVTEGRRAVMNISGFSRPDWGIPVVYTRAQDGRLFDPAHAGTQPFPAPVGTQPQTAAQAGATVGAATQPIGQGLSALTEMVQSTSAAREAAVAARTDFQVSSQQIETLSTYKDIHDQLHSLQIHCFNLVVLETRRETVDDVAWDSLSNYELTLQGIVEQLGVIAVRAPQIGSELTWVGDLVTARHELGGAIENLDMPQLKKATRLLNRVLMIQPAQINARLSSAARLLRLPSLVEALSHIHANLPALELDAEKLALFESAVLAIDNLSTQLGRLVAEHDRFQAIDLELRRIEVTLEQDLMELELSWPDLQNQARPLYQESSEAWASAVRSDAEKLDAALAAQDPTRIRHFFRRYRRQMSDRFYRADIDLKRLCDELRKVGEPLTGVLRAIA